MSKLSGLAVIKQALNLFAAIICAAVWLFLGGQVSAGQVTLTWDRNPEPDIAGYYIYQGSESGNYTNVINVGMSTTNTVSDLVEGGAYYFAVTAYNLSGLESGFSNEISYTVPGVVKPGAVPRVALTSPSVGQIFRAPATVTLAAAVTANGSPITKVQFLNGGTLLGEDTTSPYSFNWSNVSAGSYTLLARVVYGTGQTVNSASMGISVTNPPSSIALTSPTQGQRFGALATVNLAAAVTANGNPISKVQFLNGGTLLGEDTSAPYTFSWSNAGVGSHALVARVIYGTGQAVNSASVGISVATLPPSIALTSPTQGQRYAAPATVTFGASVTANGNSISKVQFLNGSTVVGEDTTAPYSFSWSSVRAGSYTLLARVVYGSWQTVNSASRGISVLGLPAPWRTRNIGSVAVEGSAGEVGGLFSVEGAGRLGGVSDSFRFVYQPLTGDGEIVARVPSMANPQPNGHFGVMIRENFTDYSSFIFMGVGSDGYYRAYLRDLSGQIALVKNSIRPAPSAMWVRLSRKGENLLAFRSGDGVAWTQIFARKITMAANVQIGLVVASGSATALSQGTFSDFVVVP